MMQKFKIFSFIFLSIITTFSCTERERLNPLDPLNPETHGKPQGLKANSIYHDVFLRWYDINVTTDFIGYKIYRKTHHDSSYKTIAIVGPDQTEYSDENLTYDQKYYYALSVVGEDFESIKSDSVVITPGPSFVWMSDIFTGRIVKLTHDCSHIIYQEDVDGEPWLMVYDSLSSKIWYTDILLNKICTYSYPHVLSIVDQLSYGEPFDIVFNKKNKNFLIADRFGGRILVYDKNETKQNELYGIHRPYAIATDDSDGSLWVADPDSDMVAKISGLNEMLFKLPFSNPFDVDVDQQTGDCWIAAGNRVYVLDRNGNTRHIYTENITNSVDLVFDTEKRKCWILDYSYVETYSRALCFTEDWQLIVETKGLTWPNNLVINKYDHSCIVSDGGGGRIIKISEDGKIYGQISGFEYPVGLAIE